MEDSLVILTTVLTSVVLIGLALAWHTFRHVGLFARFFRSMLFGVLVVLLADFVGTLDSLNLQPWFILARQACVWGVFAFCIWKLLYCYYTLPKSGAPVPKDVPLK